ncbi:MAG: tRNA (guanine-N(7)-)-methyltransferase (tRNA(m7G46)-methyltransferase) [Chaenotheca gracillima]|nr:MAG: tRNA (guanine-N(7)-)-methyltransferase (tRNA(m7G46)-methyltransferase) [Chaenotheca gracillima]
MADALCGPSNALQHFQKHTSTDRSLQQDRLQSHRQPSQGFRSSPGPNAGILDPEFEAFQRGFSFAPPPPELQHGFPPGPSNFQNVAASRSPEPAAWAADFQKLHLSEASRPSFQAGHRNPDYLSDWDRFGDGNHQQISQAQQPTQQHGQPAFGQSQYMGRAPMGVYGSSMYGGMNPQAAEAPLQTSTSANQQPVETFDDAAFELAFDSARSELLDREEQSTKLELRENGHEALNSGYNESLSGEVLREDQARIGADAILQKDEAEPKDERADQDELARTAGTLLDSVRENQSQKFQDSTFMALMRRLRDKEVVVEGEDFVEAYGPEGAPYDTGSLPPREPSVPAATQRPSNQPAEFQPADS